MKPEQIAHRTERLKARITRIEFVEVRAAAAHHKDIVASCQKEKKRRAAELAHLEELAKA